MAGDGAGDPTAASVERDLTARDGGVLATYTLTAAGEEPVTVDVVDGLPSKPDAVEEIGVHPEFEPARSDVDGERIVFRDTVDPDGELVVKYGISAGEPVDAAALAEWDRGTRPRVAVVEGETDGPLTRGAASEASPDIPPADEQSPDPNADDEDAPGDTDEPPADGDLDLGSGDDGIIDDLTDGNGDGPRDFVAAVSGEGFAADAMGDARSGGAMEFEAGDGDDDHPSVGGDGFSAMAEAVDDGSSAAIRVDRFRSRLAALAGASLALHAAEDDAAAAALLDGMAEELEAIEAEFEALRRAHEG